MVTSHEAWCFKNGLNLGVAALLAISLTVGWIWLVAGIHLHEMIVGVLVVFFATRFLLLVHRSQPDVIQFHWQDIAQGWRIPGYVISGIWEMTVILFKDLFQIRRAGSYYRACGFKTGKRDGAAVARRVLATLYTTTGPTFLVIGIDPELSRMLFHQVERSGIPKMTQSLGAQS
jgi:hypothetical protein